MTKWIAFIVVATYPSHPILEWPDKSEEQEKFPSIDVDVKNDPEHINLHMERTPRVHKMIGIAADVTVNMPATAMIEFPSEHLCKEACVVLGKQTGVISVSAIEVQT